MVYPAKIYNRKLKLKCTKKSFIFKNEDYLQLFILKRWLLILSFLLGKPRISQPPLKELKQEGVVHHLYQSITACPICKDIVEDELH